ncbi:hypothetical protein [Pseudodesulfovibrio portus]|uniref:hypothetical protein n=1 Tax=Pseudodesulfovibrio portus TaxID=231439 RepID=UPI00222ECE5C|nr:hypothetical protein [Pseudodesulfovibrio portus]
MNKYMPTYATAAGNSSRGQRILSHFSYAAAALGPAATSSATGRAPLPRWKRIQTGRPIGCRDLVVRKLLQGFRGNEICSPEAIVLEPGAPEVPCRHDHAVIIDSGFGLSVIAEYALDAQLPGFQPVGPPETDDIFMVDDFTDYRHTKIVIHWLYREFNCHN